MSAGLELVKWLAFAAMICDHVDLALFDRGVPVLHAIGRFAFPAFAIAFGIGLAKSSDPLAVGRRLVLPGLVAQLAWTAIPGGPSVNVLLVFAACAWLASCARSGRLRWFLAAAIALFAPVLEGGVPGLVLVLGSWAAVAFNVAAVHVVVALPFLAAAASPGLLAGLAAPHLGLRASGTFPRVPGLLAWAYAAHLAVLGALRAAF